MQESLQALFNQPIATSDFVAMIKRKPAENERPYNKIVITKNNERIDLWMSEILPYIEMNGKVFPNEAYDSLSIMVEGFEILSYMKNQEYIPYVTDREKTFWINFFQNGSVENFCDLGRGMISIGWNIVTSMIKHHFAMEKYEKVYSKSSSPLDWFMTSKINPLLFKEKQFPFWNEQILSGIQEKLNAVLSHPIEPSAL